MPVHDGSGSNQDEKFLPPRPEGSQRKPGQLVQVNRVRGRCVCKASSCRRRAKFSRTRSSRERKELTIHPRRCRSDTLMARIVSEVSEFSFFAKSFILQVYDLLARHLWVHFRYGPVTCSPALRWLSSVGFIGFVILRRCDPSRVGGGAFAR